MLLIRRVVGLIIDAVVRERALRRVICVVICVVRRWVRDMVWRVDLRFWLLLLVV